MHASHISFWVLKPVGRAKWVETDLGCPSPTFFPQHINMDSHNSLHLGTGVHLSEAAGDNAGRTANEYIDAQGRVRLSNNTHHCIGRSRYASVIVDNL